MRSRRITGFVALLSACLLALQAPIAFAGHGSYALWVWERLNPGQYLANGPHLAKMGHNGGFTLHKNGAQCWSSGSQGRGDWRSYIVMQGDGNLVIYAYGGGPAIWASGTTRFPGGHLELQVNHVGQIFLAITDNRTYNFWIANC